MSKAHISQLRPFMSIIILITTLFVVVFFKMEVRRMGYAVLKETRSFHQLQDRHRLQELEYARYTSPSRVRRFALNRLPLGEASNGQIIHFSGSRIAVRQ